MNPEPIEDDQGPNAKWFVHFTSFQVDYCLIITKSILKDWLILFSKNFIFDVGMHECI